MTRGLGTALGLALTGLVFATSGGDSSSADMARHAFGVSAAFLAAVALLAAVVAAVRGRGVLSDNTLATAE
jgi:Na+/melibiose symporter-like transporter